MKPAVDAKRLEPRTGGELLTRGKVVLFYPPYDGPALSAPLCLLALAAPLREAGFSVAVIDAAISPDYRAEVLRECRDAICLGISVLTGPMIRSAAEIATEIRKSLPHLPVIFGGWHPTLLPEQTLRADCVDMVVRGQGEVTLLELAERLAGGEPVMGVKGVSWKHGDEVHQEPERPVEPLEALPIPAFDLIDFDAYERLFGIRKIAYATSVGCPYACNYCTDMVFYKRRFNAFSAERVISEVTDLVSAIALEEVAMLDSNFPVDVHRALAIARGFTASGLRFRWTFQASTDFLCRMSEDEVRSAGPERRLAHGLRDRVHVVFGVAADEQAASARERDVRDRAQGGPRRHSRHVQSDLRLSGRNRG